MIKRFLKIFGFIILTIIIGGIGFAIYLYQTNEMLKASIHNDESKLYYFPSKELLDLKNFKVDEIELEVDDSISIFNYYFKSLIDSTKGRVFFIHGAGGNATTYIKLIKPLVENGYNVYATDWRGYGKSNGTPNYRNVLSDTQKSFSDFQRRSKTDSLNTIVYGLSLGGQVAVKITLDNESEVDALILDGSIPSAQQMAIDYAPIEFLRERVKQHPERFNQDYVAIRDISKIKKTPKLIIHSTNDTEVKFKHGESLYEKAKEPKSFWKTNTKHIMTLADHPKETIERIESLLK